MNDQATLPAFMIEPVVRNALEEDFGRRGDITSSSIIPPDVMATAVMRSRDTGIIAGIQAVTCTFALVNPAITLNIHNGDGSKVKAGDDIVTIKGPARDILGGERVALNFASHLSGVATATGNMAAAIGNHKAKICCTRKTTPGLRMLEKQAVLLGGGSNHRFGLDDAILIKDNHIAVAGSIIEAISRARHAQGHMVRLEIEVDTLEQLDEALEAGADALLLDNMAPDTLKQAVEKAKGKAVTEASGRIGPDTVAAVAASGVDYISSGWITHSAPILDLGLDIDAG